MSDNENDGGVPIREEQKPIGRPQGTLIKFDKVHEHCLTDGIETKEKIDFIDKFLKEIDPTYNNKERPYSRIVIVEKDHSGDSKKGKKQKNKYEVGAKVLGMGKPRWFKSTRSSLKDAVNDVYNAIKKEADEHMMHTEDVKFTTWGFHELWPRQKG